MACDLADPGQIAELVATVGQQHQRLDVVIHNAAYFPLTPFAEIDAVLLQRTLSVNLMAPFFLAQAALPWMQRQGGGCILVTSSVTGPRVAYPGLAHYAASKAGVNGFIRAAALELAAAGVRVNGVEPGMIRTPAMANLGAQRSIRRLRPQCRSGDWGSRKTSRRRWCFSPHRRPPI